MQTNNSTRLSLVIAGVLRATAQDYQLPKQKQSTVNSRLNAILARRASFHAIRTVQGKK
jgi:hypothetical protein